MSSADIWSMEPSATRFGPVWVCDALMIMLSRLSPNLRPISPRMRSERVLWISQTSSVTISPVRPSPSSIARAFAQMSCNTPVMALVRLAYPSSHRFSFGVSLRRAAPAFHVAESPASAPAQSASAKKADATTLHAVEFMFYLWTRPDSLPAARASTSLTVIRLKSCSMECLRQLAATAKSIAAWSLRPVAIA